jgi:hypothetical protein
MRNNKFIEKSAITDAKKSPDLDEDELQNEEDDEEEELKRQEQNDADDDGILSDDMRGS